MNHFLLIIHVATAIVFVGALTVSASVFPRYATADAAAAYADRGGHPVAIAMHRITRVYGRLAAITPLMGLVLALILGKLGQPWILISLALVTIGAALLVFAIIPTQKQMLRTPGTAADRKRAMGYAGALNVVWLTVLVMMITKPGGVG
jgi:hypothetical protein